MTHQPNVTAVEALHDLLMSGSRVRTIEDDDGRVDAVVVELAEPVTVAQLEAAFGPASSLPPSPHGERSVAFPDTQPGDGESRWSVFGSLTDDDPDAVHEVLLRLDEA